MSQVGSNAKSVLLSLCAAGTVFMGNVASAEEAGESAAAPQGMTKYTAVLPKGKTLPEGVARLRVPVSIAKTTEAYDGDGEKGKLGYTADVTAGAAVFEYGYSDKISLQLVVPYSSNFAVEANYADALEKALTTDRDTTIAGIVSTIGGAGYADCSSGTCQVNDATKAYAQTLGQDLSSVPNGTPLSTVVSSFSDSLLESLISSSITTGVANANKSKYGETGMGDIQIAALTEVHKTDNLLVAVGGGLRFATGNRKTEEKTVDRGTHDIGVRLNVDYNFTDNALVSWEHYWEHMLVAGEKEVTDSSTGAKSTEKLERIGSRNYGDLVVGYNLGDLHESMKALGLQAGISYEWDGEVRFDGVSQGRNSESISSSVQLTASGLDYGVPVSLDVEMTNPIQGKNAGVTTASVYTLKAYYKF